MLEQLEGPVAPDGEKIELDDRRLARPRSCNRYGTVTHRLAVGADAILPGPAREIVDGVLCDLTGDLTTIGVANRLDLRDGRENGASRHGDALHGFIGCTIFGTRRSSLGRPGGQGVQRLRCAWRAVRQSRSEAR